MTESLPNVQINFSLIRKPPPSISPRPRNRLPLLGGHCCSSTALDGLTANQPHRCLSFFDVQVYCIYVHTHIHAYKYGMLSNAHWSTMAQSHWYMCTNTFTLTAILFFCCRVQVPQQCHGWGMPQMNSETTWTLASSLWSPMAWRWIKQDRGQGF